jgi:hypothetical protein
MAFTADILQILFWNMKLLDNKVSVLELMVGVVSIQSANSMV